MYAATLGELLIVEAFVFCIWLRVLILAIQSKDGTATGKKLLLTSIGLVVTSLAIFGIISSRAYEYFYRVPALAAVTACYVALTIGSFLFLLAAAIENSYKIIILFFMASAAWVSWLVYWTWF